MYKKKGGAFKGHRSKIKGKSSRRNFSKNASTHKKNYSPGPMRGGIRL